MIFIIIYPETLNAISLNSLCSVLCALLVPNYGCRLKNYIKRFDKRKEKLEQFDAQEVISSLNNNCNLQECAQAILGRVDKISFNNIYYSISNTNCNLQECAQARLQRW